VTPGPSAISAETIRFGSPLIEITADFLKDSIPETPAATLETARSVLIVTTSDIATGVETPGFGDRPTWAEIPGLGDVFLLAISN
jgi:hypothetical protein